MKEQEDKQNDGGRRALTLNKLDKDGEVLMHGKDDWRAITTHLLLQLG